MKEVLSRYLHSDGQKPGTRFLPAFLSVGCVLSIAAVVGIVIDAGWRNLWQTLDHADWVFALFVPVAVAVSHIGYTLTYWEIARTSDGHRLGFRDAARIVTTGFEPLNPRGGYAVDIRQLPRRGLDEVSAEKTVRLLGMLEYAVLAPLALLAAIYMMARGIKAQSGLLPSWIIG